MREGAGLVLSALLVTLAACNTPSEPIPKPGDSNLSGTVTLVARDGARTPAASVSVSAWQCTPGSVPQFDDLCGEIRTGSATTDSHGSYSFVSLYATTARIVTQSPAGYLPSETHPILVRGPNVLNIDLHQN